MEGRGVEGEVEGRGVGGEVVGAEVQSRHLASEHELPVNIKFLFTQVKSQLHNLLLNRFAFLNMPYFFGNEM